MASLKTTVSASLAATLVATAVLTAASASAAPVRVQAEAFSSQSGVAAQNTSDVGGGQNLAWIANGDWVVLSRANLGSGVSSVSARVASGAAVSGSIEVRSGGTSGTVLATIPVSSTGGWQTWATTSRGLSSQMSGIQTIALVFRSSSTSDFMNLNWIEFASTTATPTATVTPTPTPTLTVPAGWPGPGNTGVPAGTSLTTSGVPAPASGVITLGTAGAVYGAKLFGAPVRVTAANVTIRNSLVRGQVAVVGGASLTISDSELTGQYILPVCDTSSWNDRTKTTGLDSQAGATVNASRLNIHDFGKGAMIRGNVTLTNSWIHGLQYGYCDTNGAPTHIDGVFVWPSSGNRLSGNFIDAQYGYDGRAIGGQFMTAAIFCYSTTHSGDTYNGNRLGGGGYVVYAGGSGMTNMKWTNNVFVRDANFPNGGTFGPRTDYYAGTGNEWTNNTWSNNGAVIP